MKVYLEATDNKTLDNVSADSSFIRNINGIGCDRNPQYNNKPGLKIHVIVDSYRTPLYFFISGCNVHDAVTINKLYENCFVDENVFEAHLDVFTADTSYSSFANIHYLTEKGFTICMGSNTKHVSKLNNVHDATDDQIMLYKKRGISENFFANFHRYPCMINNYEKTIKSYEGLCLFMMCRMLAKKINRIIDIKNAANHAKTLCDIQKKNREYQQRRKQQKYRDKQEQKKMAKIEQKKRLDKLQQIEHKIKCIIDDNILDENIRTSYNKIKCLLRHNKTYARFANYVVNSIYDIFKNNVVTKVKYKFGKKTLYMVHAYSFIFSEINIVFYICSLNICDIIEKLAQSYRNNEKYSTAIWNIIN